ncbi:MAG: hypothetical protein ACI8XW_002208 [Gammaproteobacteria bacterium]
MATKNNMTSPDIVRERVCSKAFWRSLSGISPAFVRNHKLSCFRRRRCANTRAAWIWFIKSKPLKNIFYKT